MKTEKGQVALLFAIVIAIIAIGVIAGIGALAQGDNRPLPSDYVPEPNGILVYPQGDPLYDEHYANNVNVPNSQALENQSNAHFTDAETRSLDSQTNRENAGFFATFGTFGIVLIILIGLVIVMLVKK